MISRFLTWPASRRGKVQTRKSQREDSVLGSVGTVLWPPAVHLGPSCMYWRPDKLNDGERRGNEPQITSELEREDRLAAQNCLHESMQFA